MERHRPEKHKLRRLGILGLFAVGFAAASAFGAYSYFQSHTDQYLGLKAKVAEFQPLGGNEFGWKTYTEFIDEHRQEIDATASAYGIPSEALYLALELELNNHGEKTPLGIGPRRLQSIKTEINQATVFMGGKGDYTANGTYFGLSLNEFNTKVGHLNKKTLEPLAQNNPQLYKKLMVDYDETEHHVNEGVFARAVRENFSNSVAIEASIMAARMPMMENVEPDLIPRYLAEGVVSSPPCADNGLDLKPELQSIHLCDK